MKKLLLLPSLAILLFLPLCADEITKIKNDIIDVEMQIIEIENDPKQSDTLHRLKRKLELLKAKLANLQQTPQSSQSPTSIPKDSTQATQNNQQPPVKKDKHNRTGFLLGIGLGAMQTESTYLLSTLKGNGAPFGIRIGFQQFFDTFDERFKHSPVGLRAYIDFYAFAATNEARTLAIFQGFGAYNLDLLIDFHIPKTYTYIGFFGGVGYGAVVYGAATTGLFGDQRSMELRGTFYNLGVALTLNSRHRLEFLYKFLPKNYVPASELMDFSWKSSDFLGGAYQFTF